MNILPIDGDLLVQPFPGCRIQLRINVQVFGKIHHEVNAVDLFQAFLLEKNEKQFKEK